MNRPTVSEEIGENPIGLVFPFHSQWARGSAVRDVAMVALPRVPPLATMPPILSFLSARILSKSEHTMFSEGAGYNSRRYDRQGSFEQQASAFRIVGSDLVHIGVVTSVENDGFWIESPQFIEQMQADRFWGPTVAQIGTPIFFVPT